MMSFSISRRQRIQHVAVLFEVLEQATVLRTRYSEEHDLQHTGADWVAILVKALAKVARGEFGGGLIAYRAALVQLMAVAFLAILAEDARE